MMVVWYYTILCCC